MVEDRDATHEGTQIEDKPPAAEGEEASEAAAKRAVSRPQRWSFTGQGDCKRVGPYISGSLGREGPQVTRRLGRGEPSSPTG